MTVDLLELRREAIEAFSASVGPTDPQTTSAFGRLAHVALAAPAMAAAARHSPAAPGAAERAPRYKRCCGG